MSLCRKLYISFLWLLINKCGCMDDDEEPKAIPKNIPDYEYELIARSFLPFVLKYFENEENWKDFERWKEERNRKKRVQA